jgi:hypothetical protein
MIRSALQRRTKAVQLSCSLLRISQIQGENIHPIRVAAQSYVGVRSIAGNAASNPADGMAVYVVNVVCCQIEVSATGRFLVQRRITECVCVSVT